LSVGADVLQLMLKASQASISAKFLLDAGDIDGACNRAYYAMFDAARAALIAGRSPVPAEIARTHSGLISAFGLHLVKTGLVANELGRMLNRAEEIRLVADYKGDSVELEDAREVVRQAAGFVEAMRSQFLSR